MLLLILAIIGTLTGIASVTIPILMAKARRRERLGRTFVRVDKSFVKRQESLPVNPSTPDVLAQWPAVAQRLPIRRDVHDDVLGVLTLPRPSLAIMLIRGGPFEGKSCLLRQIGRDLALAGARVLEMRPHSICHGTWQEDFIEEAGRKTRWRVVLVDDLFTYDGILDVLRTPGLDCTVVATTKTSECTPSRMSILESLRSLKITTEHHQEWPELPGLSSEELARVSRSPAYAAMPDKGWESLSSRQGPVPLLAVVRATSPTSIPSLRDFVEHLQQEAPDAYRVLGIVSGFYRLGVLIPHLLLSQVASTPNLREFLASGMARSGDPTSLRDWLHAETGHDGSLYWRLSHVVVAEDIWQIGGFSARAEESRRPLWAALDPHLGAQRQFVYVAVRAVKQASGPHAAREMLRELGAKLPALLDHSDPQSVHWARLMLQLGHSEEALGIAVAVKPETGRQALVRTQVLLSCGEPARAFSLGQSWLREHDEDSFMRGRFLRYVERHASRAGFDLPGTLEGTWAWLKRHKGSSFVRGRFLMIAARHAAETSLGLTRILNDTWSWLRRHPKDTFVRGRFLTEIARCPDTEGLDVANAMRTMWGWVEADHENLYARNCFTVAARKLRERIPDLLPEIIDKSYCWMTEGEWRPDVMGGLLSLLGDGSEGGTTPASQFLQEAVAQLEKAEDYPVSLLHRLYKTLRPIRDEGILLSAASLLRSSAGGNPDEKGLLLARTADLLARCERLEGARKTYEIALACGDEREATVRQMYARFLVNHGCFDDAESEIRSLLGGSGRNPWVFELHARWAAGVGRFELAEAAWWWAIALAEPLGRFLNGYGRFLVDRNREREAEYAFRAASQLSPGYFWANKNLGDLARARGMDELAQEYYVAALDAVPRDWRFADVIEEIEALIDPASLSA